jgi:hypothetical protein
VLPKKKKKKKGWDMAQVVAPLPSKHEDMSSNPVLQNKTKQNPPLKPKQQ